MRQCAETLALQLEYLKSPGIALGVLILRIAEICEEQIAKVKTHRETHALTMEKQRQAQILKSTCYKGGV